MIVKLYDTNKKKLIGVFRTACLAARYLYHPYSANRAGNVNGALSGKSKIYNSRFEFPIAVRPAAESDLIDNVDWIIADGYPEIDSIKMKGYTTTRSTMWKEHCANRKFK